MKSGIDGVCAAGGAYTPAFGMYGAPAGIVLGNGSVSEQADALVAAIYQTIGTRLGTASNTDLEGYVVFLIGQRLAPEVVNRLDRLAASNSRLASVAQNVRALARRKISREPPPSCPPARTPAPPMWWKCRAWAAGLPRARSTIRVRHRAGRGRQQPCRRPENGALRCRSRIAR
jgi:hypothetical protein